MDFTEKKISSQPVFKGRMIGLRVDTVVLPNGKEATRECIEHPGAVAIVAVDDQQRVCLVRQFRYPVGEELLEIPAGKLDPGENPLDCAQRELLEESGILAAQWKKLFSYYTTPGFCDEILHIYLATELTKGHSQPDEDEFLEASMVPLKEAFDKIKQGVIKDSKTLIGLLYLEGI